MTVNEIKKQFDAFAGGCWPDLIRKKPEADSFFSEYIESTPAPSLEAQIGAYAMFVWTLNSPAVYKDLAGFLRSDELTLAGNIRKFDEDTRDETVSRAQSVGECCSTIIEYMITFMLAHCQEIGQGQENITTLDCKRAEDEEGRARLGSYAGLNDCNVFFRWQEEAFGVEFNVGEVIVSKSFYATCTKPLETLHFSCPDFDCAAAMGKDPYFFVIQSPAALEQLRCNITTLSAFPSETEVLWPPSITFTVIGKKVVSKEDFLKDNFMGEMGVQTMGGGGQPLKEWLQKTVTHEISPKTNPGNPEEIGDLTGDFLEIISAAIGPDGKSPLTQDVDVSKLIRLLPADALEKVLDDSGKEGPVLKKLFARLHYELKYPLNGKQAEKIEVEPHKAQTPHKPYNLGIDAPGNSIEKDHIRNAPAGFKINVVVLNVEGVSSKILGRFVTEKWMDGNFPYHLDTNGLIFNQGGNLLPNVVFTNNESMMQKAFFQARKALAKHNKKKLQKERAAKEGEISASPAGAGIIPSSSVSTHGTKKLQKENLEMQKKIGKELELLMAQGSVGGQGGGGKQYRRTTKKSRRRRSSRRRSSRRRSHRRRSHRRRSRRRRSTRKNKKRSRRRKPTRKNKKRSRRRR